MTKKNMMMNIRQRQEAMNDTQEAGGNVRHISKKQEAMNDTQETGGDERYTKSRRR